jgi:nitroreductase/NAD-dependent dihydropyrimidine dehydrogenase PreA subunit
MALIAINERTCTKCGICADECPSHIISFQTGSFPQILKRAETGCIRCGHCVAICPTASLNHRDEPLEKAIDVLDDLKVTPEQCEQLLKGRRSVRVFKDQPVPREIIAHLIEVASYAPTGHNSQEVEWLVIDNKKNLAHIEDLATGWIEWVITNQPQMAASFNMKAMLERQKVNHNTFLRGASALLVTHANDQRMASIDSAIALGYLDLAANTLGLGTCWAGLVLSMANTFPPIKEAIALPEGHSALGCLMLGYNRFKYQRIPVRKEPGIIWR